MSLKDEIAEINQQTELLKKINSACECPDSCESCAALDKALARKNSSVNYSFGFDPQHSNIDTKFELKIECDIRFTSREDFGVTFVIVNQDDDSEIDFHTLDIRDRALIADKAWGPPSRILEEAYQDFLASKNKHYDKYANNF